MKNTKILLIVMIVLVCVLFCACKDGANGNSQDVNVTTHSISGTLHKVNVIDSATPFVHGGSTEYKVVYDATNYYAELAASFIVKNVSQATGATLQTVSPSDVSWSSDAKLIVLNDKTLFANAGLYMPNDDIGLTGYYIKTVGKSVFVMNNGNDGYQLGAIALLRAVLGYDMFSGDCVVYKKTGETLPTIDIVERPDYDYRQNPNKLTSDAIYGLGYTQDSEIWIPVGGTNLHNSFKWLPLNQFFKKHPKWYSSETNEGDANGETTGQLCYTAHGDEAELNLMVETAFESAKNAITNCNNKNARNISMTIQDNPTYCKCEACEQVRAQYGCISASTINFLNRVDDKLQEWLQQEADASGQPKREINLIFFAYYAWEAPPVDANLQAIDGIKCNEHVGVYIAPIQAKYNASFYAKKNEVYANNIRGWANCSDIVCLWLYQTNFNNYLYPLNDWNVVADNYRFGKENNAVLIYDEGQLNQGTTTAFGRLKDYVCSKMEFDVNADYSAVVDEYFANYYREAAEPMREFFDELQTYMTYLETKYSDKLAGGIRDAYASQDYWSMSMLEGWLEKIDTALRAVEKYKDYDVETYNMLVSHIKIESIFPRYALCTLYEGIYDAETLQQMRKSFRDDCLALGIERSAEWTMIDATFKSWGL